MSTALPRAQGNDRARGAAGWLILFLLVAAPLALGAVHEPAYVPLLLLASVAGLLSLWSVARQRGWRAAPPPAARLGLAWLLLIFLQLLPLPPRLLAVVSPGSFAFHDRFALGPVAGWHPISVDPVNTLRGLAFVAALLLLYAAAWHAAAHSTWRHRAQWAIVTTGFLMTIEALVQAASSKPSTIYGLWRPQCDWAVFGPYVNHNHFANYLVMAAPLSAAMLAESLGRLAHTWRVRRWLVFGDPPAANALIQMVVLLTLLVGLFATGSRGGVAASLCSLALLAFVLPSSRRAALILTLLLASTFFFIDPLPLLNSLQTRGLAVSRLPFWRDALRTAVDFPLFGAGLNAYGTLSPHYQSAFRGDWIVQAHNDYLQALVDTGLAGLALVGAMLMTLVRAALSAARRAALGAGLLAALCGAALHAAVDFTWQIPANTATFVVLAGIAMSPEAWRHGARRAAASLDDARSGDLECLK